MLAKSRITRVKLLDGKTLHFPSDIELRQLWNEIESITYEELMTKEQFEAKYVLVRSEEPKQPIKSIYWICNTCGRRHAEDYICTMLGTE